MSAWLEECECVSTLDCLAWSLRRGLALAPVQVRAMAGAFALGMAARAVPCWGEPCDYCSSPEPFCEGTGAAACTRSGAFHAYWRLPLRPNNYFRPGLWGHFALCYLPTLANGAPYDRLQVQPPARGILQKNH